MDVIIVGAGIAGLATALELDRVGIKARIYESVEEIMPLGVGINLLPHATKVLGECGLLDALKQTAIETEQLIYLNKFGQKIWSEPRGTAAGYEWPQFSIHRGDLQAILLGAARERLGDDRVCTGHHLVDVSTVRRARARFVKRKTGEASALEGADLVVAADGIHSTVRAKFYPQEGAPKWNGVMFWRGTTQGPPILSGREMVSIGYPGRRFVAYPISKAHAERGRSLINWVVEIAHDPSFGFRQEEWNRHGNLTEFLPLFESWVFGWIDVPAVMKAADAVYAYPCIDRDPIERWTYGRVTLLGDAAHPMYPIGSNGASQAILDARALAEALASDTDIDRALIAYEATRRPATTKVVLSNRRQGPAEIQAIVEKRAPNGFDTIETIISDVELTEITAGYKRLAGFDRGSVNITADKTALCSAPPDNSGLGRLSRERQSGVSQ